MITDRAEALRIAVSIMNTCHEYKKCKDCPFVNSENDSCVIEDALDAAICYHEGTRQTILNMLVEATKGIVIPVKDEKDAKEKEQKLQKFFVDEKTSLDALCYSLGNQIRQGVLSNDDVSHPNHYQKGGMECIDAIRAAVTDCRGFEAYYVGNIIKYIWRYKEKNGIEDLQKAAKYLEWLQEEVKENETRR